MDILLKRKKGMGEREGEKDKKEKVGGERGKRRGLEGRRKNDK